MSKHTIESQFRSWLLSRDNRLNEARISRKSSGERQSHLRFYSGCGIDSVSELLAIFDANKITYQPCDAYTGSPLYKNQGFNVQWNGHTVGVLLGVAAQGHIVRKQFSPKNLGLAGKTYSAMSLFRKDILQGLTQTEKDASIVECLVSMLDNIEQGTPVIAHPFLKQNLNKVTSDFGEVLGAYISVKQGHTVHFPDNSNNNIADFYEDNVPVSAKGRQAGNTLNLGSYKDLLPRNTPTELFLYSLSSHNKDLFFETGAKLCAEAAKLADWVGGTTEAAVAKYVKSITYDQFYNKIAKDPVFQGLGIPLESKNDRPRDLWQAGSTDPFYFTLNTVINRLWGRKHTGEITKIIKKLGSNIKFLHIDIENSNIKSREVPFVSIERWGTHYWSRATKAWHNWMAVQSITEEQQ
jgi:hypothetical protein